jgi:hypothetical protein
MGQWVGHGESPQAEVMRQLQQGLVRLLRDPQPQVVREQIVTSVVMFVYEMQHSSAPSVLARQGTDYWFGAASHALELLGRSSSSSSVPWPLLEAPASQPDVFFFTAHYGGVRTLQNTAIGDLPLLQLAKLWWRGVETGHGFGRMFVSTMERFACRRQAIVRLEFAHYPTFYTVDSHYHWRVHSGAVRKRRATWANVTPASLFPRNLYGDKKENDAVPYHPADLGYVPPLLVVHSLVPTLVGRWPSGAPRADLVRALLARVTHWYTEEAGGGGDHALHVSGHGRWVLTADSGSSAGDPLLRERLAKVCVALGNLDADGAPLFVTLQCADHSYAPAEARALLMLLIMLGRAFARPLMVDEATLEAIAGPDGDLDYPLGLPNLAAGDDPALYCNASPAFLPLPLSAPADARRRARAWVPQRKPHSVASWEEDTVMVPTPLHERLPFWAYSAGSDTEEEEATQRAAKKPRLLSDACFACHRPGPAGITDDVFVFCNVACMQVYYHQD